MVALIGVLAYFDIHISARLLGIALISEVVFLLIFDVLIFGQGGENIQTAALNPVNAFKNMPGFGSGGDAIAAGAWAVGVFFAFWSWVGFEMAPNYGEESKNPKKIVPMAMYISVIGLGIFYVVTSWAAISGYATTEAAVEPGREQRLRVLPRPGQAVRERVPPERPELADHHRLVRLRDGLPQHDRAVSLLARS